MIPIDIKKFYFPFEDTVRAISDKGEDYEVVNITKEKIEKIKELHFCESSSFCSIDGIVNENKLYILDTRIDIELLGGTDLEKSLILSLRKLHSDVNLSYDDPIKTLITSCSIIMFEKMKRVFENHYKLDDEIKKPTLGFNFTEVSAETAAVRGEKVAQDFYEMILAEIKQYSEKLIDSSHGMIKRVNVGEIEDSGFDIIFLSPKNIENLKNKNLYYAIAIENILDNDAIVMSHDVSTPIGVKLNSLKSNMLLDYFLNSTPDSVCTVHKALGSLHNLIDAACRIEFYSEREIPNSSEFFRKRKDDQQHVGTMSYDHSTLTTGSIAYFR